MRDDWTNFEGDRKFSTVTFQQVEATEQLAEELIAEAKQIRAYIREAKVESTVMSASMMKNGKMQRFWRRHFTEMDVATAMRLQQEAERLEERARIISDKLRYGVHQEEA